MQAHATIFDFCNPGADYEEKKRLFERSITGAKLLGASWIVVHPSTKIKKTEKYHRRHMKKMWSFSENMQILQKKKESGLAIENMWGEKMAGVPHYAVKPEEVLRLIEDIQCDNVKVCWDAEHGSIEKLIRQKRFIC
mgnify:CR=1 FL=1